jgi:hypothetical protein
MSNPLFRVFSGLAEPRRIVEAILPRRSFDDVILPSATRRALDQALAHVTSHDLIFNRWGLGERHPTGLALAFNFAGPPGTGKTICAEAIAHSLARRLLVVRYAEVESMWMGATPKNVSAVFRLARDFRALAETYKVSGGDIRNAVLKAAMAAASEPGGDALKAIHHRHLEEGIRDVLAGKRVMKQSLFDTENTTRLQPGSALATLIGVTALLVALAALIIALLR